MSISEYNFPIHCSNDLTHFLFPVKPHCEAASARTPVITPKGTPSLFMEGYAKPNVFMWFQTTSLTTLPSHKSYWSV